MPVNADGSVGFGTATFFNGSSNGMQFKPHVSSDTTLKAYNTRIMAVESFSHIEDAKIGSKDLEVSNYACRWSGESIDIGFAFN